MSELSFGEVGEILQLVQAIEGSEIDLEWGDLKIQVRRGGSISAARETRMENVEGNYANLPDAPELHAQQTAAPRTSEQSTSAEAGQAGQQQSEAGHERTPDHWVAVKAPMAGTFYWAPTPDDPPFAGVGETVAVGDTVALIEVMKLFTELKTETAGKVARIDVPDNSLVEFGQVLVWIEPA